MRKIMLILLVAALLVGCTSLDDAGTSSDPADSSSISSGDNGKSETIDENTASSESRGDDVSDSSVVADSSAESSKAESVEESKPVEDSKDESSSQADTPNPEYEYTIDIKPYLEYIYAENLLLVNKEYRIDETYEPEKLVNITYTRKDGRTERMDPTAEMALRAFLDEAYAVGYDDVTVTSGYRSYKRQNELYTYYISQEMEGGKSREEAIAAVNKYSAIPGTSEHHTGLCVDMHNLPSANQKFGETEAGKWMAANAHRFGFILRYPAGSTEITGYMYEPWHFRFVGVKHASAIYESGVTLEEYVASRG